MPAGRWAVLISTKTGLPMGDGPQEWGVSRPRLIRAVEDALRRLGTDRIDLLQLHCPPSPVFGNTMVYGILDQLVAEGKIRHYGVSVERVDEALEAIRHPGVATVQIIFNMFRLKPAERFLAEAARQDVGVLARVPLASGLLTGKLSASSQFAADDHRNFNRGGEAFDQGETFSGVPYDVALAAVEQLRALVPPGATMTQFALRWILMFEGVTCAIPGARTAAQARDNAAAADLPPLDARTMDAVREIYDRDVRPLIYDRW